MKLEQQFTSQQLPNGELVKAEKKELVEKNNERMERRLTAKDLSVVLDKADKEIQSVKEDGNKKMKASADSMGVTVDPQTEKLMSELAAQADMVGNKLRGQIVGEILIQLSDLASTKPAQEEQNNQSEILQEYSQSIKNVSADNAEMAEPAQLQESLTQVVTDATFYNNLPDLEADTKKNESNNQKAAEKIGQYLEESRTELKELDSLQPTEYYNSAFDLMWIIDHERRQANQNESVADIWRSKIKGDLFEEKVSGRVREEIAQGKSHLYSTHQLGEDYNDEIAASIIPEKRSFNTEEERLKGSMQIGDLIGEIREIESQILSQRSEGNIADVAKLDLKKSYLINGMFGLMEQKEESEMDPAVGELPSEQRKQEVNNYRQMKNIETDFRVLSGLNKKFSADLGADLSADTIEQIKPLISELGQIDKIKPSRLALRRYEDILKKILAVSAETKSEKFGKLQENLSLGVAKISQSYDRLGASNTAQLPINDQTNMEITMYGSRFHPKGTEADIHMIITDGRRLDMKNIGSDVAFYVASKGKARGRSGIYNPYQHQIDLFSPRDDSIFLSAQTLFHELAHASQFHEKEVFKTSEEYRQIAEDMGTKKGAETLTVHSLMMERDADVRSLAYARLLDKKYQTGLVQSEQSKAEYLGAVAGHLVAIESSARKMGLSGLVVGGKVKETSLSALGFMPEEYS